MHINHTLYSRHSAHIACLNVGVKYHLTVDSFNEGGITRGSRIMEIDS
ncbi:MAG: hypothetical protein J6L96_08525 [Clostridia bacterium]|nr:hypothetical protein [Clostridia bacterium]